MSIELLAKQGRDRIYGGLAAIESSRLRKMRDEAIRTCFTRFDEASHAWIVDPGTYRVLIGSTSADIRAELELQVR